MENSNIIKGMLLGLLVSTSAYAEQNNFNCPSSQEIQSTDFTAPSIWVAPPVAHAVAGQVGVGLGGKEVKKLIGVEPITINGKPGWLCVYKSKGGVSANDYQAKIRGIVAGNKFLIKQLDKVNKIFDDAQPYLKNYPKNEPLGFVGYQLDDQSEQSGQ